MNTGTLVKRRGSDCMDIRFGLYDYHGGLQCGETLDVKISGKWVPTRIEMGDDWYLVGINVDDLVSLFAQIITALDVSADFVLRDALPSGKDFVYKEVAELLDGLTPKQRRAAIDILDAYVRSL